MTTAVGFTSLLLGIIGAMAAWAAVMPKHGGLDKLSMWYLGFSLSGGELAAMIMVDAITRLLPGALGYELGAHQDSHSPGLDGLLEGPHYTRPPVFRGDAIPPVLLSGHHAQIERWRRNQSLLTTLQRRPELLALIPLSKLDKRFLLEQGWQESDGA